MQAILRTVGKAGHIAPATLLGHNLEMAGDTAAGLSPDRLSNTHFVGPADRMTGIAHGWQPGSSHNLAGIRFYLTPGMGLEGCEAQLIHNYSGRGGSGILQTGRFVRAGEQLGVTLWARAQHHPVNLSVGLRPWEGQVPLYDKATIPITTTYWQEYRTALAAPEDDNDAVFFCFLEEEGLVWLDQIHLRPEGKGIVRPDLVEAIRGLEIPVLRFPGGCISTNYHWRYGTGPEHLRPTLPDPVFKWETEYSFGTDEYLTLCHEMGIKPHITVNIGTGTPGEAGEWAAYCAAWYRDRGLDTPEIYWQMGNEHYGVWELGNMSGEMYADALWAFVPAVRAAYPRARIVALGPETGEGLRPGTRTPWRAPVLDRAGHLVDLLALQWYVSGWDEDPSRQKIKAFQGVQALVRAIQAADHDCRQRGLDTRIAVTEWNYWLRATHHDERGFLEPYDVLHGLFAAEVLHQFARLAPSLELANFYHLVNPMGVFISRGPIIERTLLADLFQLYRPAFPARVQLIEVLSSTSMPVPHLADGIPTIDALALCGDEAEWLFITNRSEDEEAVLSLEDTRYQRGVILSGASLDAMSWTHQLYTAASNSLVVPPLSVVRLQREHERASPRP